MKREEAINLLGWLKSKTNRDDDLEAIGMAIEALHREEAEEKGYCHRIRPSNVEVVVRCKDCRWWNEDDFPRAFPEEKTSACECPNIYGANFSRYTQEDEFCSRGVRKGGDDE